MERGRGNRDDFFGSSDPFGGFEGLGGFGNHQSLVSNFFGGRDPFDDPFFSRPFGSSFGRIPGSSMFGSSMFGPSMFDQTPSLFEDRRASGFIQNQPPQENRSRGPVIEEINSDEEDEGEEKEAGERQSNQGKHSRASKGPYVEDPDDVAEERKSDTSQYRNEYNRASGTQPQTKTFSFQSSTVTYGGVNGAYYSSSTSRKMGSDGVVVEESKEADTTSGKATHRLSRGIREKGHSVTRKLNPDGKVDTVQTLHNLNEDELPVFEEAWKGSARQHLPGWEERSGVHGNPGSSRDGEHGKPAGADRVRALNPSREQQTHVQRPRGNVRRITIT